MGSGEGEREEKTLHREDKDKVVRTWKEVIFGG